MDVNFFFLFAFVVLNFVVMVYLFKWSAQWAYEIKPTTGQALMQWIVFVIIEVLLGFVFLFLVNPFFFGF